jgi:hypothetical protein
MSLVYEDHRKSQKRKVKEGTSRATFPWLPCWTKLTLAIFTLWQAEWQLITRRLWIFTIVDNFYIFQRPTARVTCHGVRGHGSAAAAVVAAIGHMLEPACICIITCA